jgi:hypothetical protein
MKNKILTTITQSLLLMLTGCVLYESESTQQALLNAGFEQKQITVENIGTITANIPSNTIKSVVLKSKNEWVLKDDDNVSTEIHYIYTVPSAKFYYIGSRLNYLRYIQVNQRSSAEINNNNIGRLSQNWRNNNVPRDTFSGVVLDPVCIARGREYILDSNGKVTNVIEGINPPSSQR